MVVIILSASSVSMFVIFIYCTCIKTIVKIVKMILQTTNVYHWQKYVLC